jgi:hypothetical protein
MVLTRSEVSLCFLPPQQSILPANNQHLEGQVAAAPKKPLIKTFEI